MPYGSTASIRCPYFKTYNKHIRGNTISITCEPLCSDIGFDMTMKSCFRTEEERRDYMELFCCDLFDQCPLYKAISQKHAPDPGKIGRGVKKEKRDGKK